MWELLNLYVDLGESVRDIVVSRGIWDWSKGRTGLTALSERDLTARRHLAASSSNAVGKTAFSEHQMAAPTQLRRVQTPQETRRFRSAT